MYPTQSSYHDMKELEEIIQTRIYYITNFFKEEQVTGKKTRQLAALPENFLETYNLGIRGKGKMDHRIKSFAQVGMEDPFPEDSKKIKGSLYDMDERIYKLPQGVTDLVYSESRYVKGNSPCIQYFPRPELMFKLMRASLGVTSVESLWFNK